jgi:hypothetical protein
VPSPTTHRCNRQQKGRRARRRRRGRGKRKANLAATVSIDFLSLFFFQNVHKGSRYTGKRWRHKQKATSKAAKYSNELQKSRQRIRWRSQGDWSPPSSQQTSTCPEGKGGSVRASIKICKVSRSCRVCGEQKKSTVTPFCVPAY